jgi:hypothetical protein
LSRRAWLVGLALVIGVGGVVVWSGAPPWPTAFAAGRWAGELRFAGAWWGWVNPWCTVASQESDGREIRFYLNLYNDTFAMTLSGIFNHEGRGKPVIRVDGEALAIDWFGGWRWGRDADGRLAVEGSWPVVSASPLEREYIGRIMRQVRSGRVAIVDVAGQEYSFDLTGADEAVTALQKCLSNSRLPLA